ncbi:Xaa-Pro peptidase family protein [Rhizobium calliandrae]|uniref:Xaa-Pro peptidase family protein n=1 Tax=Rhizobium calliandrae TaxID=1312182 RepID=A0ABT7KR83_9HYPH|nr:Xaa-Pro peptidase family protein [Rhizobium calliandrae]MDL2410525.1 Xaa-Pro peptidase family protein [Rhizobium calliandrae]
MDDFEYITGEPTNIGPAVAALKLNPPFPPHAVPRGAEPTKVPMGFMPQMPLAERNRRWDGLRKRMLMANVDAILFLGNDIYWDMGNANIRYIANAAFKMGTHMSFFLDSDPVVWSFVAHMNRPYNFLLSVQDWVKDVRTARGLVEIAADLRDRGLGRGRIGIVGFNSTIQTVTTFLSGDLKLLERELPNVEFLDMTWALQEMRMVKSEAEIGMMREAAKISRKVLDVLVEIARPGKLECEVYAEMIRTQIANGGEPNIFNLFASGPIDHPTEELWHLLHGMDQPVMPSRRPLAINDLIVTEWHTKYGGYLVHTEYTVYVGEKVPDPLNDIFKVCVESLDASREALKVGNTLRDAWEAVRKPAERAGYDFVELGFHAMGLGSPEFPTVIYKPGYGSNALNGSRIGDLVLEEGMTFGNNLDLFDPKWKPDVGCMYSDFMVVRPNGAELLVNTPRTIGIAY